MIEFLLLLFTSCLLALKCEKKVLPSQSGEMLRLVEKGDRIEGEAAGMIFAVALGGNGRLGAVTEREELTHF